MVPVQPRNHLQSARILTNKHQRDVRWEVRCIVEALSSLDMPVVLLKGAAYLMAGVPAARARLFSDIDILVPKSSIQRVEQTLRLHGWLITALDDYDQHYYRTWMHELPPMRHSVRNTTLDVHHNILPPTAKLKPDPEKLLQEIVPVDGFDRLYVLSAPDMILHSATHLFHEGEFEHGLRDLLDLDALLRHFGTDESFWERLVERAAELDLTRPLYYMLRYTAQMINTPIPGVAMKAAVSLGRPTTLLAWWMDVLFERALRPDHSSCDDAFTPLARWMLYIRSHYLRMPFYLLLPHLIRKAIKNRQSSAELNGEQLEKN